MPHSEQQQIQESQIETFIESVLLTSLGGYETDDETTALEDDSQADTALEDSQET